VISDFRREVDENCTLLSHYAACSGIPLKAEAFFFKMTLDWVPSVSL